MNWLQLIFLFSNSINFLCIDIFSAIPDESISKSICLIFSNTSVSSYGHIFDIFPVYTQTRLVTDIF